MKLTPEEIELAEAEAIAAEVEARAGYVWKPERSAERLEAQGWRTWLTTIFPFAFPQEFAPFHCEFWDAWWNVCERIKHKEPIPTKLLNYLLLWGRALAKSSSGTPSTLMKAAFAGRTYSIYLSETIDQASSHLANVRYLITHPDSKLAEYYPHLQLDPSAPTALGIKGKDAENLFITKGGSVFRALGMESASRGLILGGKRPDDFNVDDIDSESHSMLVSKKHLNKLTRAVLLTRDISSDLSVTVKVLQNIVIPTGVVNQIHTGKSDAFAERTTIGVVNTFKHLDMESYIDENGKTRHRILPTSVPSWEAVSIEKAQTILDLIGHDGFMAECQNEFDQFKSGLVVSNYDEEAQVITWSQFEQIFGQRRIPAHWQCLAGLDVGYSSGAHPHYSAWDFIATAAMNSPLPNALFVYRSRSFIGTSIDDQADAIKADLYRDERGVVNERITSWQMSHERTGEMMTLNEKHQLPFGKFKFYGAEDGVAQWKHLSLRDRSQPHPFRNDALIENNGHGPQYLIGRPQMFYIVEDDQLNRPVDDHGLRLLREQVSTWEYVPVKLTEQGLTQQKPSKVNDDHPDVIKGLLAYFGAMATMLTREEKQELTVSPQFRLEAIEARSATATEAEISRDLITRQVQLVIPKVLAPKNKGRFARFKR